MSAETIETENKSKLETLTLEKGFVSQQHQINLLIQAISKQMAELKDEIQKEIPK